MTQECIGCKKLYKRLTREGRCYYCHYNKHGTHPKEWEESAKNIEKKRLEGKK